MICLRNRITMLLASLALLVHCFFSTAEAFQSQQEESQPKKDAPFVDNNAFLSTKQPVELLNSTLEKSVTKQSNFAYLIWKSFGTDYRYASKKAYFDRLGLPENSTSSKRFNSWLDFANANQLPGRRSNPADYEDALVDKWLVQEKASLDFAEKVASSPHYFSPITIGNSDINKVFPRAAVISRDIVTGLITRSDMQMRQGDLEGAWQSIFACFRISRLVSQEPSLRGMRFATSFDKQSHGALLELSTHDQFSKELAEKCKKDLLTLAKLPTWADKLEQGEKALALHRIELVKAGGPRALLKVFETQRSIRARIGRPYPANASTEWSKEVLQQWEKTKPLIITHYDELASMIRQLPRSETHDTRRKWNSENLKPLGQLGIWDEKNLTLTKAAKAEDLAKLILLFSQPELRDFHETETLLFDRQQLAPIVLAIGAFRATNGDYPDKLQDLVPDYIEDVVDHLNATKEKPAAPFNYFKYKSGGYSLQSNAKLRKGNIHVK